MQDIELNSQYAWNYQYISINPKLSEEFIVHHLSVMITYPELVLYWYYIPDNSYITFDIVERHMNCPWNWSTLYCNPNITCD